MALYVRVAQPVQLDPNKSGSGSRVQNLRVLRNNSSESLRRHAGNDVAEVGIEVFVVVFRPLVVAFFELLIILGCVNPLDFVLGGHVSLLSGSVAIFGE